MERAVEEELLQVMVPERRRWLPCQGRHPPSPSKGKNSPTSRKTVGICGHGTDLQRRERMEVLASRDGADSHGQPAQDVEQDIVRELANLVDLVGGIVSHRCVVVDLSPYVEGFFFTIFEKGTIDFKF